MMEPQPILWGNGFAVSRNLNPNLVRIETLKPLGRETRRHPPAQIRKLQGSIEQFGFVLDRIDDDHGTRALATWAAVPEKGRYAVTQDNIVKFAEPGAFEDPLTEVLRCGARKLLAQAVEAEVCAR